MSIKVMSAVFDAGGLRPAQKSVLLALADHANEDGNSIYPSVSRVVIKTGLSERAVRKALSELRDQKVLVVIRESTQHFPTEYAINMKKLQSLKHPDLHQMHPDNNDSPAPDAPLDTPDLHDVPSRPAPDAPKSSVNPQELNRHFNDDPESEYKERIQAAITRGALAHQSLQEQVEKLFSINPNWRRQDWKGLLQFLKERPKDQTVEKFSSWWKAKDWRGKNGQPPNAAQIMELWPQAFKAGSERKFSEVY